MISIVLLTHQSRQHALNCLHSFVECIQALHIAKSVEFVLIDDCSEQSLDIIGLFRTLRASTPGPVQIIRFKQRQHYAYGIACALSVAQGQDVLFFSHDMIVAPVCLKTLLAAANESDAGILRCRSQHMDYYPDLQLAPPAPLTSFTHIAAFAQQVAARHGTQLVHTPVLIGDSMLIKRKVIDRIGVFDTGFYGLMADIDYGLRADRAGLAHTVAMGAWLHHEGAVVAKMAGGPHAAFEIRAPYQRFREKWDTRLPQDYFELTGEQLIALRTDNRFTSREFEPLITLDPLIGETF